MPRGDIEKANENYVLKALDASRDGGGVKHVRHRVNDYLRRNGISRRLTEQQALAVLESLAAQGKAAKQITDPAVWLITPRGRGSIEE